MEYNKILVLYNITARHWYVIGIFPKKKIIMNFDSLGGGDPEGLNAAFNWLHDECMDQDVNFPAPHEWQLHYAPSRNLF